MAGRDVARVVNKCNSAKEDNKLDLSRCDLTQIPDAIFFLLRNTSLESCNISDNLIRRIPSKFAVKFSTLKELRLSSNHLSSLPDEMRQIEGLTLLDISHNHFTTLPHVIYRLDCLKILNAEDNTIKDVDVLRLKRMPNIEEVNFQDNPLTASTHTEMELWSDDVTVLLTPQHPDFDSVD